MSTLSLKDLIREKLEEHFFWRGRLAQLDWALLADDPSVAEANQFLSALQDRYTRLQWTSTDLNGPTSYCGLGALFWPRFSDREVPSVRDDRLPVTSAEGFPLIRWIFPSSPASDAGLHVGDALLSLDRQDVVNVPLARLAQAVLGNKGSDPIHLKIIPADGGKVRSVSLVRRIVELPLLLTQQEDGIDYIRLSRLNLASASSNFAKLLSTLSGWARILDLRGFSGCDLTILRQLAAPLLAAKDLIARQEQYVEEVLTRSEIRCPTCDQEVVFKPSVALSDHETLSAGEALIGALRHHNRATIFGANTGGKGTFQFHFNLREESNRRLQLSVTAGKFYTPGNDWAGDGNANRIGIAPNRRVSQSKTNVLPGMAGDAQYEAARDFLNGMRTA